MPGLAKRLKGQDSSGIDPEVYQESQCSCLDRDSETDHASHYDEGMRCAEMLFFDYWRQHMLRIKITRILKHLRTFRADTLFQLVHNFLGRKRPIKGTRRIDIPPDNPRQAHDALEIRLWVFFAQEAPDRCSHHYFHRAATLEQYRLKLALARTTTC